MEVEEKEEKKDEEVKIGKQEEEKEKKGGGGGGEDETARDTDKKRKLEEEDDEEKLQLDTNGPKKSLNGSGNAPDAPTAPINTQAPPVSKRQLKRQQRHARWLEGKAERRQRQREKEKAKRVLGVAPSGPSRKALKRVRMADSECRLRVALDMSLEALMDERRLGQCLRQAARCYSANRRANQPLQLYLTSFQGRCKERMAVQVGYESWDVHFRDAHYLEAFPKEDIVYLTSESASPLTKLDDTKVYVIGGLVDYNRLKGHCLNLAEEHGLATAHLPLGRYLDMRSRKVLTIDQVFRVILGVAGGQGWREALLAALPARKGAKGKEEEEEEDEEEETQEEREDNKSDENSCKEEKEEGGRDDDGVIRKNMNNCGNNAEKKMKENGIEENIDKQENKEKEREEKKMETGR